nr:acyltransferase family protein [Paenibacillus macerans]
MRRVLTIYIDNKKSHGRIVFADILRIIAIFAVINIHVTGSFSIASFTTTNITNWWVENIFNGLSKWSVPVFFMVSGMLMLSPNKNESLKVFFTKRFNKVFIPFVAWGILYEILKPRYMGTEVTIKSVIKDFLTGSIYWHFWFMYAILVIYLLTPIIKSFVLKASKEVLIYSITVWFILSSILPLFEYILNITLDISTNISFIGSYAGYYVLGYILYRYDFGNKFKVLIYAGAIISAIFTPISTYYLTKQNGGNLNAFFTDNLSVNIVFISIAIFMIFKSINWDKLFGRFSVILLKWTKIISESSFGIFLIHFIVLNELVRSGISIFKLDSPSMMRVPITNLAIFITSFLIIYLLRHIPVIKKFVP